MTWYPNGPLVSYLPFPVKDPDRNWGNVTCHACKDFCTGHYKNVLFNTDDEESLKKICQPPSILLKDLFSSIGESPNGECLKEVAASVLLSIQDVKTSK